MVLFIFMNMDISNNKRIPFLGKEGFETLNFMFRLWQKRRFIGGLVFISMLFGMLFSLFAEKIYISNVQILPQKEESMNMELGALAGLAGINVGSMFGENLGVSVDLYPQIAGSYDFIDQLINSKYSIKGESITLRDYFVSESSFGDKVLDYTFRLPWTLKAMFGTSKSQLSDSTSINPEIVLQTKEDARLFKKVKSIVSVSSVDDGGLVTLSVELNNPVLAAQIAHRAIELLQQFVVDYRTGQIRAELEFLQQRYQELTIEYEAAREKYLSYKDRHRYQVGERISFEFKVLEDEYSRKEDMFSDLARQLEQTKLMMRKETPEFVVFEPVKVPLEKSSPRTLVVLFLCVVFSLFIGVALIAGHDLYVELKLSLLANDVHAR